MSNNYVIKGDFTTYQTTMNQTANSLTRSYTTISGKVDENGNAIEETKNTMSTMIRESASGIEIGKVESKTKAQFSDTKLEFTNDTNVVASVDNGKFYGKDMELMESGSFKMGNQIWLRRGNGHLSLKSLN